MLRECLETGLVYLENPPHYAAFEEEFAWEVTRNKEAQRRQADEPLSYSFRVWWKGFRTRLRSRNQKVFELAARCIRAFPNKQISVVDLGCGEGDTLMNVLSQLPDDVLHRCVPQGVEISKKLAALADAALRMKGGSCLQCDALSGLGLFPNNSVDLIILANFLEHEINPLPLLRGCHEKLCVGGQTIIKVPNYDCFGRKVRGRRWCGFRWPDHVNYFTPKTLQALAVQAGFQVARMTWLDHHPLSDNMYAILKKAS